MTNYPFNKPAPQSIALTRIQKLIGKRMLNSKLTKPCFYLSIKVDVTELMELRHQLKKSIGIKVTTNAFYVRALAQAVLSYPVILAKRCGDYLKIADSVNVGFAVTAPQGLVVPVIKNAHQMSLGQIAEAGKAHARRGLFIVDFP